MARFLVCVALLLLTAGAYGEDESSISPSPVSSSTTTSGSGPPTSSSSMPPPTSAPNVLNYTFYNSSKYVCAMMSGAIQIHVGYNLSDGHSSRLIRVSVVNTTEANFMCNSTFVTITLNESYPADTFLFNITFFMQHHDKQWNVSDVQIHVNVNNSAIFKNNTEATKHPKGMLYGAQPSPAVLSASLDEAQSYSCDTNLNYTMTVEADASDTYNLTLSLENFKLQVFQPTNTTEFEKAQKCPADIKGSKIVPIAVGIALAGLVLIVIVAYIVGRLRSRKQNSYEALS